MKSCSGAWIRRCRTARRWEITRFHEREDGVIEIDATIYCEKASHRAS